jgi:TM2 domain-containing membrane protein YozV
MRKIMILFFFSFLPGVAHFYLGLPNRGFQLLAFYSITFLITVKSGLFPFLASVFWCISFGDLLYQNKSMNEHGEIVDKLFINWQPKK